MEPTTFKCAEIIRTPEQCVLCTSYLWKYDERFLICTNPTCSFLKEYIVKSKHQIIQKLKGTILYEFQEEFFMNTDKKYQENKGRVNKIIRKLGLLAIRQNIFKKHFELYFVAKKKQFPSFITDHLTVISVYASIFQQGYQFIVQNLIQSFFTVNNKTFIEQWDFQLKIAGQSCIRNPNNPNLEQCNLEICPVTLRKKKLKYCYDYYWQTLLDNMKSYFRRNRRVKVQIPQKQAIYTINYLIQKLKLTREDKLEILIILDIVQRHKIHRGENHIAVATTIVYMKLKMNYIKKQRLRRILLDQNVSKKQLQNKEENLDIIRRINQFVTMNVQKIEKFEAKFNQKRKFFHKKDQCFLNDISTYTYVQQN